jgi:hypothetical protein
MSAVALEMHERTVVSSVRAMAASTAEFTDWAMREAMSYLCCACCTAVAAVTVSKIARPSEERCSMI